MNALAMLSFVLLFAFGGRYFGWHDPTGKVQLALCATYILGLLSRGKFAS